MAYPINNEIFGEEEDDGYCYITDFFYNGQRYLIDKVNNWNYNNQLYFIIFRDNETFDHCRISMMEPKYLGFEGEELVLSKEEINCMINTLNSKLDKSRLSFDQYVMVDTEGSIWQYIIARINEFNGNGDDKKYPLYSLNLPMPDYTLLYK